jgi:hypothetical protein
MSYLGCSVRLSFQLFVGGLISYLGCSVRLLQNKRYRKPKGQSKMDNPKKLAT